MGASSDKKSASHATPALKDSLNNSSLELLNLIKPAGDQPTDDLGLQALPDEAADDRSLEGGPSFRQGSQPSAVESELGPVDCSLMDEELQLPSSCEDGADG